MGLLGRYFLLLILLLVVAMGSSLRANGDELLGDFLQEEYGYDFGAYPAYFSPVEGVKFDNTVRADHKLSYMKKVFTSIPVTAIKVVDVLEFGAKGNGKIDDTKAFESAWKEACSSPEEVTFVIPSDKTFLLKPLRFSGPCNSHITMEIGGDIEASADQSDYNMDRRHWLLFEGVEGLDVEGGGVVNGNGNVWWQNSCKIDQTKPCQIAPTALTFYNCTNLRVRNLRIQNAQQIHVSFEQSTNVEVTNLIINAPEKSPNTDGIHITGTQNIQISNTSIGTGDDCISIVSGSHKVRATDISCGPGHGISIGSLGSGKSEEYVSDVVVNRAKLSGTTNGVRIKTWQGGSGSASNIRFQNLHMQNVENPIIVDQYYCDQDQPCKEQVSAVQVKNVMYQNIKGTSASNAAINFKCSKRQPCQGIVLQNVNLVRADGAKSEAVCSNVNIHKLGNVSPDCL